MNIRVFYKMSDTSSNLQGATSNERKTEYVIPIQQVSSIPHVLNKGTKKTNDTDKLVSKIGPSSSLSNVGINVNDNEKFKDLSYTDVQINLRLLGDLKEGEKVMIVDGKYMQVDQRYGQSLRRYWTDDSRNRTVYFIEHVIEAAKKYCNEAVDKINMENDKQINLEKLINIQSLLRSSLTGLSRISATYSNDKHNMATVETFRTTIQTFCDQDLKRAITEKYPIFH